MQSYKDDTHIEDISADGKYLVAELGIATSHAQAAWAPGGEEWHLLGPTPPAGVPAAFSPDNKWLAYGSSRSGDAEVYIMDFPQGVQTRRVSTSGGAFPRWRRDGKELFYVSKDNKLMAVPIPALGPMYAGEPVPLFAVDMLRPSGNQPYSVTSDGQRFLMADRLNRANSTELVLNWPSLLSQI